MRNTYIHDMYRYSMEKQILEIIKEKDTYKISVEISENSKQEPSITIKVHTDQSTKDAVDKRPFYQVLLNYCGRRLPSL